MPEAKRSNWNAFLLYNGYEKGGFALHSCKNIIIRIKSTPAVVAAFPFDKQIFRTADAFDFISTCGMVPFTKDKSIFGNKKALPLERFSVGGEGGIPTSM